MIGVEQTNGEFLNSKICYRRDLYAKVKTCVTSYICNVTAQIWSTEINKIKLHVYVLLLTQPNNSLLLTTIN